MNVFSCLLDAICCLIFIYLLRSFYIDLSFSWYNFYLYFFLFWIFRSLLRKKVIIEKIRLSITFFLIWLNCSWFKWSIKLIFIIWTNFFFKIAFIIDITARIFTLFVFRARWLLLLSSCRSRIKHRCIINWNGKAFVISATVIKILHRWIIRIWF